MPAATSVQASAVGTVWVLERASDGALGRGVEIHACAVRDGNDVSIIGAGITVRASTGGHQKIFDATMAKLGLSAKERQIYLRGLREKLKF